MRVNRSYMEETYRNMMEEIRNIIGESDNDNEMLRLAVIHNDIARLRKDNWEKLTKELNLHPIK